MKRLALLVSAMVTALVMATPTAAHAQSGGGCRNVVDIASCSSYSNSYGRVSGDFYLNDINAPECWAKLYLVVNGTSHYKYTAYLDHLGRYPESHYYITSNGSAYTKVQMIACDGATITYTAYSPTIYFP